MSSELKMERSTKLVRVDKNAVEKLEAYKKKKGGLVSEYVERGIELVLAELEAKDRFIEERTKG